MQPTLSATAAAKGGAFTRRDALLLGYTPDEIRHLLSSGQWVRLRRGTYAAAAEPSAAVAIGVRASAVLVGLPPVAAASHVTAAMLTGLPLLRRHDDVVHVTVPQGRHRRRNGIRVHACRLAESDVVRCGGLRLTSPARTAVDLARSVPLADALVAADAALARGTTEAELASALARLGDVNGLPKARRVLELADGRAESPGESLSRLAISRAGLPLPDLQHRLRDAQGFVGRVDFWWPDPGVVGEFDGRGKYVDPGHLWAEKRREDRLRAMGLAVVRWVWADVVGDFTAVAHRLSSALRHFPR